MSNFGRGLPKEHSCEIVSKSVHWFNRRSHLSFFSICSRGSLTVSNNAMYENRIVDFLLNMLDLELAIGGVLYTIIF